MNFDNYDADYYFNPLFSERLNELVSILNYNTEIINELLKKEHRVKRGTFSFLRPDTFNYQSLDVYLDQDKPKIFTKELLVDICRHFDTTPLYLIRLQSEAKYFDSLPFNFKSKKKGVKLLKDYLEEKDLIVDYFQWCLIREITKFFKEMLVNHLSSDYYRYVENTVYFSFTLKEFTDNLLRSHEIDSIPMKWETRVKNEQRFTLQFEDLYTFSNKLADLMFGEDRMMDKELYKFVFREVVKIFRYGHPIDKTIRILNNRKILIRKDYQSYNEFSQYPSYLLRMDPYLLTEYVFREKLSK